MTEAARKRRLSQSSASSIKRQKNYRNQAIEENDKRRLSIQDHSFREAESSGIDLSGVADCSAFHEQILEDDYEVKRDLLLKSTIWTDILPADSEPMVTDPDAAAVVVANAHDFEREIPDVYQSDTGSETEGAVSDIPHITTEPSALGSIEYLYVDKRDCRLLEPSPDPSPPQHASNNTSIDMID